MTWGLRLVIRSAVSGAGTPAVTVSGGTLAFGRLGAGSSLAKRDVEQPAEIVFHAAYLEKARSVSEPEYKPFATLSGSLLLDREAGAPVFVCSPDVDFTYVEPEPSKDDPVRRIQLGFDTGSFKNPPAAGSPLTTLRLPEEPPRARFFELGLELRIGGAIEAAREVNGRLDVPLGPIDRLETTLPRDQLVGVVKIMSRGHFVAWMTSIFGHDIPHRAYLAMHADLVSGRYPMPPIEIVRSLPDDKLAGYDRAKKKILIRRSFIRSAELDETESAVLLAALIEEFGHSLDDDLRTRLSKVGGDAELDEGARFGYLICNLGWDLKESTDYATYHRDGTSVPLHVRWTEFKRSIDRVLGPEEQRSDDMAGAIEFFGAGRANEHGKPGQSFAHESIEDILKDDFPDPALRHEIYFGNWLRDYSQAITPVTLQILAMSAKIIDAQLPGTNPTMRLQSDPRGVITDILDVYARAKFADVPQFRVTKARLGVYRSPEHIDNPHGLETSPLDPDFDRNPTTEQRRIDPAQRANYIAGRLARPARSAAEYMREEFSVALALGPVAEGRRRFGQGLHTLEDFFAHSNFCELALRAVGKTTVEPWTSSVTEKGKTFFPLVTGKFGGDDSAASIFLAIGELLEKDMDKPCEAGERALGLKIGLILLRDLRPHIAKQAEGALDDLEAFKKQHPIIFTLMCRTIGVLMRFLNWLIGVIVLLIANQIDEAQVFSGGAPSENPTHTQLAKDHDDHVLHVLAADCAKSAVKDVAHLMAEAWQKPPVERGTLEAALLDRAESYFVHPDLVVQSPGPPAHLVAIINIVQRFAANPANAAAIVRASKRTVLDQHLKEAQEFGRRVTKAIPLERLKEIFGL